MKQEAAGRRIKFFGPGDLANAFVAEQAVEFLHSYVAGRSITCLNDALELYNALEFARHEILPVTLNDSDRGVLASNTKVLTGQISDYFLGLNELNLDEHFQGLEYEYMSDLLMLLQRFDVGGRIGKHLLFEAIFRIPVPLWVLLSNSKFVKAYDRELSEVVLSEPANAIFVLDTHLIRKSGSIYTLPLSLSGEDYQQLLLAYIDSESPHPNYTQVIAEAKNSERWGITDKVRMRAKNRLDELSNELLVSGAGSSIRHGYGVRIDPLQDGPVLNSMEESTEGVTFIRSLGGKYLQSTKDPFPIIENFAYLIGYMDELGFLLMPSFRAQLGILRQLVVSGKESYPRDSTFHLVDGMTIGGTQAYYNFLQDVGIDVESIIEWFFNQYISEAYEVHNFCYTPSDPKSSFLTKIRHLAPEMDGIAKQYSLFCEEGELDRELFTMSSRPRSWKAIPSLSREKYLVAISGSYCETVLGLLFDGQIGVTYISEEVKAERFVDLVTRHEVRYDMLRGLQQKLVDSLIVEDLVAVNEGILALANLNQIAVLRHIHYREAAPFKHYGPNLSEAALALVDKGWLSFHSALLTPAEASYFNFWLNRSEFSDGPDLRNSYSHGTNTADLRAHEESYLRLLRLMISLVLKINDDLEVATASSSPSNGAHAVGKSNDVP